MCISAIGLKELIDPRSIEIEIVDKKGVKKPFDPARILELIDIVCSDMNDDSKAEALYSRVEYSIFGGMTDNQLKKSIINAAEFYSRFDDDFKYVVIKLISKLRVEDSEQIVKESKKIGFAQLFRH